MEKSTTSERDAITELISKAKFHADEALDVGCNVTPTLYVHCHDGSTTGYRLDKLLGEGMALSPNLRLMCVAEGADAAVLCAEGWIMRGAQSDDNNPYAPAPEPTEREEVVTLLVASREESFQRVLPVIRMDDGQFFRFGDEVEIRQTKLLGQWDQLLPDEIPDKDERERAESLLKAQGITPLNGKGRERGLGLAWF